MMILRTLIHCTLAAALAGLAAPALAAAPASPVAADSKRADAGRSRRVELPFPLDNRSTGREQPAPSQPKAAGRHPFREQNPERALLAKSAPGAVRGPRLSRRAEFG